MLEETGLMVTDAILFSFGCNPELETVKFPNGDECQFFLLNFYTKSYSGDLRALEDESLALE